MAHGVKVPTANPDGTSSIPGTCRTGRENCQQTVSNHHTHAGACPVSAPTTHTPKINKQVKRLP